MTKNEFIEKYNLISIQKGDSEHTERYFNKERKFLLESYGWVKFYIDGYDTGEWDSLDYRRLSNYIENY